MPYLEDPPLAFAHRGGAAEGDENTADAFDRAIAAGYRYMEIDVRTTRDGVVMIFHDETMRRLTGTDGSIGDLSFQDLSEVRVGGAAAIPRLDDVLAQWPGIKFNIDVKDDAGVEPTVAAIRKVQGEDRTLLASFSDKRLRRLRQVSGGDIATSMAQGEVARLWLASRIGRTIALPASAVAAQVPVRYKALRVVDRRFVTLAHRLGIQVHVWTIDDPAEMAELLDLGVDGIMTDRIEVLRQFLVDRGSWK